MFPFYQICVCFEQEGKQQVSLLAEVLPPFLLTIPSCLHVSHIACTLHCLYHHIFPHLYISTSVCPSGAELLSLLITPLTQLRQETPYEISLRRSQPPCSQQQCMWELIPVQGSLSLMARAAWGAMGLPALQFSLAVAETSYGAQGWREKGS